MKVLFLPKYPYQGASSRYRVYQYLPHLQGLGIDYQVSSFMSDTMYQASFSHGRSIYKVWLTLLAIFRRLLVLRHWRDYDVIYMQREMFPGPLLWAERWLRWRGAKLVFDYDDALFIPKSSQFNPLAGWLKGAEKTLSIFRLSHCVVAGNNYLRDVAAQYGPEAVTLEVAEDTHRIKQRAAYTDSSEFVIGWLGSSTTVKYLNYIADALLRIHARFPQVVFEVMGGDPDFSIDGLPIVHRPWSLDGELEVLGRFDVGLMPLPLEEWSRGKSGGKARTYMAGGVVPVCTAIGYNLELIQHGETGFLCTDQDQWYQTLVSLIEDRALCQRVSDAARAYVEVHFDVATQAAALGDILRSVAGGAE